MFLTGEKADVRIPLCYMLMNAIALHLRYIVLFRLVLNPQEKINSWIIMHNIKRFEFVPEFLDRNFWSAGSVGDSERCGIQWMKSVRVYDVFSFVPIGFTTFDLVMWSELFYHLIHFRGNIVCCFPFWKEDFVKKLQSCEGKADMFVERSRNKSIDKKSVLCYSESTNYIQSVWTSRFSRGKNTS